MDAAGLGGLAAGIGAASFVADAREEIAAPLTTVSPTAVPAVAPPTRLSTPASLLHVAWADAWLARVAGVPTLEARTHLSTPPSTPLATTAASTAAPVAAEARMRAFAAPEAVYVSPDAPQRRPVEAAPRPTTAAPIVTPPAREISRAAEPTAATPPATLPPVLTSAPVVTSAPIEESRAADVFPALGMLGALAALPTGLGFAPGLAGSPVVSAIAAESKLPQQVSPIVGAEAAGTSLAHLVWTDTWLARFGGVSSPETAATPSPATLGGGARHLATAAAAPETVYVAPELAAPTTTREAPVVSRPSRVDAPAVPMSHAAAVTQAWSAASGPGVAAGADQFADGRLARRFHGPRHR